jgi:tetratricopeptide (TPR) repeat protein/O-antigen ligase
MENMERKFAASLFVVSKSAFLLISLSYLIYLSSYVTGWFNPIVLGILVVLWLIFDRAETGLELAMLVFCGVMVLVSFASIDPRRSFEECWLIAVGLLFIQISAFISKSISPQRVVTLLLVSGAAGMAWLWWNTGVWYSTWLAAAPGHWLPEISFRLAGGNNSAAFVNILLMASLPYVLLADRKSIKILSGLYAVSAVLLLVLSSSRGGWLGAAAGLVAMAFLFSIHYRLDFKKLIRSPKVRRIGYGVLAGGSAALVLLGFIYVRLFENNRTHGPILEARSDFWPVGLKMFLQSPMWGKGINTFESFLVQSQSTPPFTIFLHAHNQYLDFLSGGGIIGLGALIYLLYHLYKQLRLRWVTPTPNMSAVLIGGISALICFLVHGFFDGLYRMPDTSFALAVILGACLSFEKPATRRIKWMSFALGMAVVIFGIYNTWRTAPVYEAVSNYVRGQYSAAIKDIQMGIWRDPTLASNYQQAALFYDLEPEQELKNAGEAMQQTIRLDPNWPLNYANLGAIYRQEGLLEQASNEFKTAVRLAPKSQLFYLNLGEVEELMGNQQDAQQAYAKVLELYPDWASAYFWRATALRRSVLVQVSPHFPAVQALSKDQLLEIEKNGSAQALDMIDLAAYEIANKDYEKAGSTLNKVELMYMTSDERLELSWQEADYLAATGRYAQAVKKGEVVMEDIRHQGVEGPGSLETFTYTQDVFKMPAVSQDLVKELTVIKYNALWGTCLWKLSGWYQKLGDLQNASRIQQELKREIPDFYPPLTENNLN